MVPLPPLPLLFPLRARQRAWNCVFLRAPWSLLSILMSFVCFARVASANRSGLGAHLAAAKKRRLAALRAGARAARWHRLLRAEADHRLRAAG